MSEKGVIVSQNSSLYEAICAGIVGVLGLNDKANGSIHMVVLL